MSDVTTILTAIEQGDPHASEKLLPLVYNELRKLAAQKLDQEQPGQTLQATALVHEAYLRLLSNNHPDQYWDNRGHFFAAASEAMRRILVESARRRSSIKRGGEFTRVAMDGLEIPLQRKPDEILQLDVVLDILAQVDPRAAKLVKLRYFVGLKMDDVAQIMKISPRTAADIWNYARAWLRVQVSNYDDPEEN